MINQLYEMVVLLKSLKKNQYANCTNCTNGSNFNDFNKVTIFESLGFVYHIWVVVISLSTQIVFPL